MLNIYYARENVDKDQFICDGMQGSTILLVPDQYTLEAEKDILRRTGKKGLLDIEVLGFSRLSDRVLSECGKSPVRSINKYGRFMLITKLLREYDDKLTVYRGMYRRQSFASMMNDFLAQIRQNNIDAASLCVIRDSLPEDSILKKKLNDTCIIYSAYEEAIAGRYIDTEMSVSFMADKIKDSRYISSREIWVSGFDSFTPRNIDVLSELMKHAVNLNIVLTYDEGGRDEHLFTITGNLISILEASAQENGIEHRKERIEGYILSRPSGIEALEKNLYAIPVDKNDDHAGIEIVGAAGIYQEIESAAAFIHGLVRDEGLRYRDIAVICNSMDTIGAAVERTFRRYGIPVFADTKRKAASNPLAVYFMAMLRMAVKGISTQDVLTVLKSGYSSYEKDEIDELENYLIQYRIKKKQWNKEFIFIEEKDEEMMKRLNTMREEISGTVSGLEGRLREAEDVHSQILAIYEYFVSRLGIESLAEEKSREMEAAGYAEASQMPGQIWNSIVGVLQQADEILGAEGDCLDELPDILEAGISELETGIIPPVCDAVSMGTAQRSRIAEARAVVVIGADEGVFPASQGAEILLSDEEINRIDEKTGTRIARTEEIRRNEEALGIYRTFARAGEHLWIGTAMADEKGDAVKPSPVINTILRIFDNLKMKEDIFADESFLSHIPLRQPAEDNLTAALRDAIDGDELDDRWREVIGWMKKNDSQALSDMEEALFYSPVKDRLSRELAEEIYMKQDAYVLSPSELENFARCPFAHFMSYGIRPQERRVFEMSAREIGDVYHEVFMTVAMKLTTEGLPITDEKSLWMTITQEEYVELAEKTCDEIVGSYKDGFMNVAADESYRVKRLKRNVTEIGWVLVQHVRAGDIKEAAFEAEFGRDRDIPPIVIEADGREVYIEGKIDRIDILSNDRVKVIDYKTGSESFSEEEARSGWKLQLMVYLKAGMQYREGSRPAGVFYFLVDEYNTDVSDKGYDGIKELVEEDVFKHFKMDGAVINDADAILAMAGEFEKNSPIIPVKFKDGEYGNVSSAKNRLFTDEEFEVFQQDVNETIRKICEGIVTGDIDIRPKKKKKKREASACAYCRFKPICGFDSSFPECRYDLI